MTTTAGPFALSTAVAVLLLRGVLLRGLRPAGSTPGMACAEAFWAEARGTGDRSIMFGRWPERTVDPHRRERQ